MEKESSSRPVHLRTKEAIRYGHQLKQVFQTAEQKLLAAGKVLSRTQQYDPQIFMDRPTTNTRDDLFMGDSLGKLTYEPVLNEDLRNFGKRVQLPVGYAPVTQPIDGVYVFPGYQERFQAGGMGVHHILFRHGLAGETFPPAEKRSAQEPESVFVGANGKPADAETIARMISETLIHGKLLRLKVDDTPQVYFKINNDPDRYKHPFYTLIMEHQFPDRRIVGMDRDSGEIFRKIHVVLGVFPSGNKAFLYTAMPTRGTMKTPPQLVAGKRKQVFQQKEH